MSEFNPVDPLKDAITDIANKTYDDAFHPSFKETGKSLSLIPRAINAALAPLQIWILKKENNISEIKKLLEIKLENVLPEKIVPAEPYVAVPTIQAISYCMDCEELRDLFASLLASSMNIDKKDNVHPSFVELIKNMSPLDAKIFKFLSFNFTAKAIVQYIYNKQKTPTKKNGFTQFENVTFIPVLKHVIVANDIESDFYKISTSIENLERLGLFNITYDNYISIDSYYDEFDKSEFYKSIESKRLSNPELSEYNTIFKKGIISITEYGKSFSSVTT